ncbi:MAG: DEAD/DEAH box helicase [Bacteroidota bacterium]
MPNQSLTFHDFKLNRQIWNALEDAGFVDPTPIQEKAIPLGLAGHDVMGIAQTGTGKTAAYLLPVIMKLKYAQGADPRAVIFSPTRELASQIESAASQLAKYTDLRVVSLLGGASIKLQREALENGADLLIATPGRFMDLYREERFGVKQIKTLILDEADKMMDMGFMPQLRRLLEVLPVKRQNMLFSATMPEKVVMLSEEFLEFPEVVEIAPQATVIETIDQRAYEVPNFRTKVELLQYMVKSVDHKKAIIFTKTKQNASDLFKFLERKSAKSVRVIHGNKDQNTRLNAIADFRNDDVNVLVATDVMSRGIDIREVDLVINFDVPLIYEDYVHRVGRTGRHFDEGLAITFINPSEKPHFEMIEELIKHKVTLAPFPKEVEIFPTPKEEKLSMERELDRLRRKEDPNFKGAFHEKKKKPSNSKKAKRRPRRR